MRRIKRLAVGLICALVASLGLTLGTTTAAHADSVIYKNGPDQYGTYNDIRYSSASYKGYFGQVTWTHNISVKAKEKYSGTAGGAEGAAAVAAWLCSKIPSPQGEVTCAYMLAKNFYDFKDTLDNVNNTSKADRCISYRWYAAAWANATRTISPIRCWTGADYCMACGYDGGSGGGGGGGGSWREQKSSYRVPMEHVTMETDKRPVPDGPVGDGGGGGSW